MNTIFKDFFNDIKYAFKVLPEYLPIVIFLSFVFGAFYGAFYGLETLLVFLGIWALVFILLPFFIFILGITNHIFGLEKDNK